MVLILIMGDWEKFNETTLPEKEKFYSNVNCRCSLHVYIHAEFVKTLK